MWQGLSVVSAIISVALPIYDVPRQVESMVEVNEKWSQLVNDYEEIWTARNSISEADYREGVRKAKAIEAELSKKVARLPHDDVELGKKTYNEVLQERHLVAGSKNRA